MLIPINPLSDDNIDGNIASKVEKGKVGCIRDGSGEKTITRIHKVTVEINRLHIPVVFTYDGSHGFRTLFPILLNQAAAKADRIGFFSGEEVVYSGEPGCCSGVSLPEVHNKILPDWKKRTSRQL